jgi:thiamine pyrophosphate-dependent acetolactate synthase large subunit-like protein
MRKDNRMIETTGAGALTKSIMSYGVDTIFALPGAQMDRYLTPFTPSATLLG